MGNVFSRLANYGYIHHRALNDFSHFDAAEKHLTNYPGTPQVLEGDLCWDFEDGRQDFYFHHPDFVWDALSASTVAKQRRSGELVMLEDMLKRDTSDRHYVIELKVGRGDVKAAMQKLVEVLQANCRDRFWIDGFSLKLARMVKAIDPSVVASLHTERVTDDHVWVAAPDQWPTRVKFGDLSGIDAIAIRKRYSDEHMACASAAVIKHGFKLIMSRLFTLEDYALSRKWGAIIGYPKADFADVMRFNAERGFV